MNITRYCDHIIFGLLVFLNIALTLFFDTRLYSVFDLSKVGVLLLVGLITMTLWLVKIVYSGKFEFPHTPLNIPILAYIVIAGIATAFSINPYMSLMGGYKRYEGLIETSSYIFLLFAFITFVNSERKLNIIINSIVGTAVVAAIYGFMQYFGHDMFKWSSENPDRIFSSFGNPVFFSAMLITILPLSLALYLGYENCQNGINRIIKNIIYGICTITIYTIFWHTKTRADFVGLIVLLPVFFVFMGRKRLKINKWKILIIITLFVSIGAFYSFNQSSSVFSYMAQEIRDSEAKAKQSEISDDKVAVRIPSDNGRSFIANKLKGSSFNRFYQYKTGLKIFNDYPIFGIGPDTLGIVYQKYLGQVFTKRKDDDHAWPRHDRVHNDILENTLARGGVGLITYIWIVLAYFWLVGKFIYKNKRDKDNSVIELNIKCFDSNKNTLAVNKELIDKRLLVVSLGSATLGYLVQNEFSFGNTPIVSLFWTIIALTVVVIYNPSDLFKKNKTVDLGSEESVSKFHIGKVAGFVLVLTVIIFVSMQVFSWYKADAYMEQGRRHINVGNFDNGLEFYNESIFRNPFELNYRDMNNNALFQVASKTNKIEWLLNVINVANANLKLEPNHYLAFYALGNAYYLLAQNHGKDTIDLAIDNYKKAIESDPFQPDFYRHLALAYAKNNMFEEAAEHLETALVHKPKNVTYLDNLLRVYLQINNMEKLKKFYEELPQIDNTTASFNFARGGYLARVGRNEEAFEVFKQGLEKDPTNLESLKNIIIVGNQLGKIDEVIKYLKRMTELKPEDIDYHITLGEKYAQKGMLNESLAEYIKIIELDGTKEKDYIGVIGNIYLSVKDFEKAEMAFKKAIELFPSNSDFYNSLGTVYAQKQMYVQAIAEIKKAFTINPQNIIFLLNLAKIYYIQGKVEDSKEFINNILDIDANNKEALDLLQKIGQ